MRIKKKKKKKLAIMQLSLEGAYDENESERERPLERNLRGATRKLAKKNYMSQETFSLE